MHNVPLDQEEEPLDCYYKAHASKILPHDHSLNYVVFIYFNWPGFEKPTFSFECVAIRSQLARTQ